MPLTTSILTCLNTAIRRGYKPANESIRQDYKSALTWLKHNPTERVQKISGSIAVSGDGYDIDYTLPIAGESSIWTNAPIFNPDTDRLEYIAQDEDGRLYLVTE